MDRQIILDTETTGLDPKQGHRLIEIGAIELLNRRFTHKNLHFYLNPERQVDQEALSVHGLNDAFLADKPKFSDVVEELLAYLNGAELIIHNAPFDLGFINHELKLASAKIQNLQKICRITDTLPMARQMHPGQKNSLDALCKRYKIDNSQRTLHGALLDAEILARVYLAMTGGQSSLLEEGVALMVSALDERQEAAAYTATQDFVVYCASEQDLAQHEKFLNLLDKKSQNACLWRHSHSGRPL